MKSNSVYQRPSILEDLGNGTAHYNYNVVETEKVNEEGVSTPSYDYDQVVIHGTPTYSKIVSAVIREKYTIDKELSLLNNYNRYLSAAEAEKNPKHQQEYMDYIQETATIKQFVKSDCLAFNVQIDD